MRTVIKITLAEEETYLPLAENLEKGCYETFEELKAEWEKQEWGYWNCTSKPTVELVNVYSKEEAEELGKQLVIDGMEAPQPLVIDLENPEELDICEEFEVVCFDELMFKAELYRTAFHVNPDLSKFMSGYAYDCYYGTVYSKDYDYFNCEECSRDICKQNPANGWDTQYIDVEDTGELICKRCYEQDLLSTGKELDDILENDRLYGSSFSNSELENAGFEIVDTMSGVLVGSGRTGYRDPKAIFNTLEDMRDDLADCVLLFQYDAMAIGGLGAYVTLWVRKPKFYRVYDRERKAYLKAGYNEDSLYELLVELRRVIDTGDDDTEITSWEEAKTYLGDVVLEESDTDFHYGVNLV